MIKILQICSELHDSKVHAELFKHLDDLNIEQTIYCFFPGTDKINKNKVDGKQTNYVYADIVQPIDHFLFHLKAWRVHRHLLKTVDVKTFDCVHAATLFTNGIHAYRIYKKYNIPYIVAVRNTDISFFRRAPHTWVDGRNILLNAYKIVFISPWMKDSLLSMNPVLPIVDKIKDKMILCPNGINDYWLDNVYTVPHSGNHKIIFVGTFLRRKKLDVLIDAIANLRKRKGFENTTLTIVGGGKDTDNYMSNYIDVHKDFVDYKGKINDKGLLRDLYRQHSIFAMPSSHETLGLVYIEALTQNVAILYKKHDGVDGVFDDAVGIGVENATVEEVSDALAKMLSSHNSYSNNVVDFERFNWNNIAKNYKRIYSDMISHS